VLFVRSVADESAIYRVPLVGGEARKIVGPAVEADWSPDGKEIGFLRLGIREGKVESSVHRIAVDGTNERLVAKVEDYTLRHLRWSPDGLALAALESRGTGTSSARMTLFSLDGRPPWRLEAPEKGSVLGFAWNGDGRNLVVLGGSADMVFRSRRTNRLFLMDSRTGKVRALFSGIDLGGSVDVFGPGSLLLVTAVRRSNLKEVSLTTPGEPGRWLTRGSSIDRQPVYAPDAEWVAFTSNRSGNNDIWEISTKTGAVHRLTDDPAEEFDPAFTRDGKRLLFSSNRSGHFEIWIAERDGSGARRVSDDGVDAENPTATPDGQWIVYASGGTEKRGIWRIRVDGSAAKQLVAGPVILPEISPDGRFVSYATAGVRSEAIRAVRFEDGAPVPVEVIASGSGFNRGRHRWMPGGGALVFLTDDEKGFFGLAMQDVTPGKNSSATRRAVTGFTPDSLTESLGISPDGTRLMVSELQFSSGLLLAEGVDGIVSRMPRGAKLP
jgi:Tol biopolymer transport system component